jgi:putative transcriptional regulator
MHQLSNMGLVRLKIRELAQERGWTLKEVSDRSGVIYSTVRSYARRPRMTTVDFTAIHKLARTFNVTIEDLVEILEE